MVQRMIEDFKKNIELYREYKEEMKKSKQDTITVILMYLAIVMLVAWLYSFTWIFVFLLFDYFNF